MMQEEKDLLLKDLCARLPYGIIVETPKGKGHVCDTNITIFGTEVGVNIKATSRDKFYIEDIQPYLFPLSSMTDELWDKEFRGYDITEYTRDSFKYGCETLEFYDHNPDLSDMVGFINQLIKNHFDIYGLISKGLASDATGLNIY